MEKQTFSLSFHPLSSQKQIHIIDDKFEYQRLIRYYNSSNGFKTDP